MPVERQAPDLIVKNGRVRTLDRRDSIAEAVAVRGERIVGVGSGSEIEPLADGQTELLDARGRTVLPGFIDGHTHFNSASTVYTYLIDFLHGDHQIRRARRHHGQRFLPVVQHAPWSTRRRQQRIAHDERLHLRGGRFCLWFGRRLLRVRSCCAQQTENHEQTLRPAARPWRTMTLSHRRGMLLQFPRAFSRHANDRRSVCRS